MSDDAAETVDGHPVTVDSDDGGGGGLFALVLIVLAGIAAFVLGDRGNQRQRGR